LITSISYEGRPISRLRRRSIEDIERAEGRGGIDDKWNDIQSVKIYKRNRGIGDKHTPWLWHGNKSREPENRAEGQEGGLKDER
jgi:hypothetical protein